MSSSMSDSRQDRRHVSRRDSSKGASNTRRPRLMHITATEPAITTANASRNALASSQSSRRATDILSRVAYTSGASLPEPAARASSPLSVRTPTYDAERNRQLSYSSSSSAASSPDSYDDDHLYASGRYYSFPSFDAYEAEADQPSGEKGGDLNRKAS